MDNVIMISRHRQWRAWQFGRRHSGLFGGGSSSGGTGGDDNGGGMDFDGFLKLPWWGRVVFAVLALGLFWLCWERLGLFGVFAWFPLVLLADGVLDMVLPDGEEGSSRTEKEKKWNVGVMGVLSAVSAVALVSPETGIAIYVVLLLVTFVLWVFG